MPSKDPIIQCCENVWCGMEFEPADGWAGLCPSCVTLLDEHWAGAHEVRLAGGAEPVECLQCRRSVVTVTRSA